MTQQQNNTSANNKRIAKNSIFMSIRMVIVLCINLYTTRVLLSSLGVEDYGVFNIVCGFVSMFTFLNTSMSNGIQRFLNYEYGRNGTDGANKVFITSLVIQTLLIVIVVITSESFGLWYLNNKIVIPTDRIIAAKYVFHFSILSFVFVILQSPFLGVVMAHERMGYFAFVSVVDSVLKFLIAFLITIFPFDNLILYGALLCLESLVVLLLYAIYTRHKFAETILHKYWNKKLFLSMLGFSGWNIFGSFSGIMKEQGINLVLNLFFGPIVNAARGIAVQINSGLQSFSAVLTTPVRPQVVKSYSIGNYERTMNLTYGISKLSCLVLYMMSLPIILEIDFVLQIWLGGNIPEHTSTFVIIILLISFLNNLNSAVSGVIHASGKMMVYQLSTSFTATMCVPLAYFALKNGGSPELALWMVFITMIFAQTVALFVLKSVIEFSFAKYFKSVILPIVKVAITTIWLPLLITYLFQDGWMRLIFVLITSIVIVSFTTLFLGLNKNERNIIIGFLPLNIRHRIKI